MRPKVTQFGSLVLFLRWCARLLLARLRPCRCSQSACMEGTPSLGCSQSLP